jgi:hypothetical protein
MIDMNQLDIAGIDPKPRSNGCRPAGGGADSAKLVALPIFAAVAASLYAGIAPLWMFVIPAIVYVVSVWASWRVGSRTSATGRGELSAWRWLYTVTAVPTSFANGLMGGFFASLPGAEEERALWALALCLIVGGTPSRGLDGRTYALSAASLVLPMAGVLVLGDGSRAALASPRSPSASSSSSTCSPCRAPPRTRQIARDLAASDLSQARRAHRDVAFARTRCAPCSTT